MIIDITGFIYEGMWGGGHPFPDVKIVPLPQPPWVQKTVYCEIFEGMHSQTGTYLETPAHWFGDTYLLEDVPIDRIVDVPCTVLSLDPAPYTAEGRVKITGAVMDKVIAAAGPIAPDTAVIVNCGWGKHWKAADYLQGPYFSKEAMASLIALKPRILAADSPAWESREDPQGFFASFYEADILMLAPVMLPDQLPGDRCTLTALPIRVEGTSCAPCRAFLRFS